MWKCPKCETLNQGQTCVVCGEKEVQNQKLNFCPDCGKRINNASGKCEFCNTQKAPKDISEKTTKSAKKVIFSLVFLIMCLIICLIIVLCFWLYENDQTKNINSEKQDMSISINKEVTKENTGDNSVQEYESNNTVDIQNDDFKNNSNVEIENYELKFGVVGLNSSPSYTRKVNEKYSYYCDIPDNFNQYSYGDTESYISSDNTAIMQLISRENDESDDVAKVMNSVISDLGGMVSYSASGEEWFAISIEKENICYYVKGFVDEYVRKFVFYFPNEYLEVYSDYIEHIEDNFKRIEG